MVLHPHKCLADYHKGNGDFMKVKGKNTRYVGWFESHDHFFVHYYKGEKECMSGGNGNKVGLGHHTHGIALCCHSVQCINALLLINIFGA